MARRTYYIPQKDDDFFTFQGNLVNIVVANKTVWGIPDPAVNALVDHRSAYEPLYYKSQNKQSRTSVDVLAHRQTRESYEKDIRVFAKAYLMFNPLVSDVERTRMALTIPDREPSPRPKINDIPVVGLEPKGGGSIDVRCRTETDQTRDSMHPAADVIECRYVFVPVGEMPPKGPDQCTEVMTSTKAHFIIQAGMGNVGKRLYGFFRWANQTNPQNNGPWTNDQTVVIA
jgi:hypothetical protein